MKFAKPPVVEVWISVDFDPAEDKRERLDSKLVQQWVELVAPELPVIEDIRGETIQAQQTSNADLLKVVHKDVRREAICLWNEERSRMAQLRDDQFAFHALKTRTETPKYSKVREAAQPNLEHYLRVFRPTRIRQATLHYLDIVEIPRPDLGAVNLKDYFPQAVDLPNEPFGLVAGLSQRMQVIPPQGDDPGALFFQLESLPVSGDSDVLRFRLEWHKISANVDTLDLVEMWARMSMAHDYMRKCFVATFSQKTLRLFEPQSG